MSYLPPDEAGFFEAVQVYFTEVTDRMALFGARDRELLKAWKQEGRSAQIVCRGIREAVESYGRDDPPRSLAQCEPFVDEQWDTFQERAVGAHDQQPQRRASSPADEPSTNEDQGAVSALFRRVRDAIESAGRATDRERWKKAYRRAWRELDTLRSDGDRFSFEELEAVDEALIEAYLEVLDDQERQLIEDALASEGSQRLKSMSPAARQQHLYVKRKRELIERYGLLDVFDVVG